MAFLFTIGLFFCAFASYVIANKLLGVDLFDFDYL